MGAQQYLRACTVSVEGGGQIVGLQNLNAQGGDRQLRVRFEVTQANSSTPHVLNCFVYNLKKETIQKLQTENLLITLTAGYLSGSGVIYKGEIKQARTFRENVADTVTHITATTAERARNSAVVTKTLSAGHTYRDRIDVATVAMQRFGITIGHIDQLDTKKFSRGFACFGMAKDLLRETCFATKSAWHNHNGVFNLLKNDSTLPGETIVINANTGMIGLPEQTIQGIVVRCLLNYRISPGQKIKLNNSSIQVAAYDTANATTNNELFKSGAVALAADGIYRCELVEHNGDTRGPNWYTEITCVRNGGENSAALTARAISSGRP